MENMILLLVALILGLLIGAAAGWFFGSRPVADLKSRFEERDGEAKKHADDLARMTPELATMSERAARADALAADLDKAREENSTFKDKAIH